MPGEGRGALAGVAASGHPVGPEDAQVPTGDGLQEAELQQGKGGGREFRLGLTRPTEIPKELTDLNI